MEFDSSEEIYHIGTDTEEIQIRDLAETVLNVADHSAELDIQSAPDGSVMRRCPDSSKLRDVGYEPMESLDDCLQRTAEWYRDRADTDR